MYIIIYIVALFNYRMAKRVKISRAGLNKLYSHEKLSTYQLAKKFDCCQATIWKSLVKFGIKRRTPYELNSNVPSKKELIQFYLNEKLSTWAIQKKYGFSRGTVYRKLKEYGLAIRDRADSHISLERKDFSRDLIEKAYLTGFRLGDLGVRRVWPNSKTILVASGSTIPEQIELIKKLFDPYCRVWIKKTKNGKINISASLNETFDFLLSKKIPVWSVDNKKTFFAFLAGFSDAEGHIGIYNNMAKFGIGNYNLQILNFLKKGLKKYKIHSRIYTDNRKGSSNSEGYVYGNNYNSLYVSIKKDLLSLFYNLKPYLKHELKIKALKKAEDNIIERNRRTKNNET